MFVECECNDVFTRLIRNGTSLVQTLIDVSKTLGLEMNGCNSADFVIVIHSNTQCMILEYILRSR